MLSGILLSLALAFSGIKMQPTNADPMYYVGQDWELKAPDKWQHFAGSYYSTKILLTVVDSTTAPIIVLTGGAIKEYMDRTYLGWSPKDMAMDLLGVGAAMYETPKYKLLMDYDTNRINLKLIRIL